MTSTMSRYRSFALQGLQVPETPINSWEFHGAPPAKCHPSHEKRGLVKGQWLSTIPESGLIRALFLRR